MFGLAGYYIYLEERVASVPIECFDRIRCEVLKVSQVFNSSDCADVFAYQWKASDSMALFYQEEENKYTRLLAAIQAYYGKCKFRGWASNLLSHKD